MRSVLSSALLLGLLGGSAIARPCPESNAEAQWGRHRHSWNFSWPTMPGTAAPSATNSGVGASSPSSPSVPTPKPSSADIPAGSPSATPSVSAPSSAVKPVTTTPAASSSPPKSSSTGSWPSSTQASSGAAKSSPPSIDDTDFQNAVLTATNNARAAHAANPVTWDSTLAKFAQDKANNACGGHATGSGYGENLYWNSGSLPGNKVSDFNKLSADGVNAWYSEAPQYDPNDPNGGFPAAGHFTQLVWKSTTAIGCAWGQKVCGSNNMWEFRCEYNPPGNYQGQYTKNVS